MRSVLPRSHVIRSCLAISTIAVASVAIVIPALAADTAEIPLDTEIASVTIYSRQAQVIRRGDVELEVDSFRIVCDDLPQKVIESSLIVEATGLSGARITGIDVRRTEKSVSDSPRYKELSDELEELEAEHRQHEMRRSAIVSRKELAGSLADLSSEQAREKLAAGSFSTEGWQGLLRSFEDENLDAERRLHKLKTSMIDLRERMEWLQSELMAMQISEGRGREVIVDCETTTSGTLTVEMSYLVPDASWYPEYTVRYLEPESEIELTYAARISQATGEDWKGVSALLSTASPHVGAAPPELPPQILGATTGTLRGRVTDATTGRPLPYANVSIPGTRLGDMTSTDGTYVISEVPAGTYTVRVSFLGFEVENRRGVRVTAGSVKRVDFALEPVTAQADEMVVEAERPAVELKAGRGAERIAATTFDLGAPAAPPAVPHVEAEVLGSEFAANLAIPKPLDLETGAEPRRSLVVRENIPGDFVLQAVPRLSDHVFVRGTFMNPLEIPILPGSAEVYVETVPEGGASEVSNFVGQDRLDAIASGQAFTMHLGVDQNVKVEYELAEKEILSKSKDKTAKIKYRHVITAENFKRKPVELWILDRVPVSGMKEVKVDDVEIEPEPDEMAENGLLTWKLTLGSGLRQEVTADYIVEYPSHLSGRDLGLEE
jgi:hypothetical protein